MTSLEKRKAKISDLQYINSSLHFRGNMLEYLSTDVIWSEMRERELLGTDNVQGQMSEHIFVYYLSNIFRNTHSFEND